MTKRTPDVEVPFVRSPYNYDRDAASDESGLYCDDPSLAVQDQRDEVDINTIVARFGLTGELPDNIRQPEYGDYTGVTDYQTAMNAVRAAAEDFMRLPAKVRTRFDNDPQKYLDFFSDPANQDEAIKLGLATRVEGPEEGSEVVLARGGKAPLKAAVKPVKGSAEPSPPLEGQGEEHS